MSRRSSEPGQLPLFQSFTRIAQQPLQPFFQWNHMQSDADAEYMQRLRAVESLDLAIVRNRSEAGSELMLPVPFQQHQVGGNTRESAESHSHTNGNVQVVLNGHAHQDANQAFESGASSPEYVDYDRLFPNNHLENHRGTILAYSPPRPSGNGMIMVSRNPLAGHTLDGSVPDDYGLLIQAPSNEGPLLNASSPSNGHPSFNGQAPLNGHALLNGHAPMNGHAPLDERTRRSSYNSDEERDRINYMAARQLEDLMHEVAERRRRRTNAQRPLTNGHHEHSFSSSGDAAS
ncbi:hypothetical protein FH972_026156 [Carpinus fangiana]|uniref:Uncharacterized protein n=1 Tax=Carpinus fangiana TaxID=176857 RepID=A0A5N6L348_9ROSI|nr:hypothetical protein FH972_026156 [Carpinus fangiana]